MNKNILIVFFAIVSVILSIYLFKLKQETISKNLEFNNIDARQDTKEESAPSSNTGLVGMNVLDLSKQNLDKLPAYVLSKTNIEKLDISDNNITGALPAEIRHLVNLKVLDASNNMMTGVPAEVGQLSKLEVLDLSNNKLTGLPYEIGNLKNLRVLNISGNNYSKQDLEVIKKGLPTDTEIII